MLPSAHCCTPPPPAHDRSHVATQDASTKRDVKNLVRHLGENARPAQKKQALVTIVNLRFEGGQADSDIVVAIASAGAIPLLVRLLGAGSPADVQQNAARALGRLALHDDNIVTIAGAVPHLVQLGPRSTALAQENAALTLSFLACNADNAVTIVDAGAISLLVQLLEPGSGVRKNIAGAAAGALSSIAEFSDQYKVKIAAVGAIPLLVQLLGAGSTAKVQQSAAAALANLSLIAVNAAIIADGAIPSLVRLLGSGSAFAQEMAAVTLKHLAAYVHNAAAVIPPLELLLAPTTPENWPHQKH
jgi:hypothetical protein